MKTNNISCPKCDSIRVKPSGYAFNKHDVTKRYKCKNCKFRFSSDKVYRNSGTAPKILLFDIETSPNVSYHWGFWQENISHQSLVHPWIIICWSAKWLYESKTFGDSITVKEAEKHSDKRVCKSLLEAFNEADIIIAHNVKKFDDKRAKTRFFLNGLQPPSPYQMIDTLAVYRKEFSMPSNKLDAILKLQHNDNKLPTDYTLWLKCVNWFNHYSKKEQQDALDYMYKYCGKDVLALEDVYLLVRPWIKNHPNLGVYSDSLEPMCYKCGGKYLTPEGEYVTNSFKYHSLRCNNCGGIGGRECISDDNKTKLIPLAR